MEAIALTRASELIQATDTVERLGEAPERVLRQAGLPMWHYCDPDDLIPKRHIFTFLDQAARRLEMPTFGLLVGAQTSLSNMGSFGRLVASSITTRHALDTGCRLIHLHNSGSRLWLAEADDDVWFCHREADCPAAGSRQKEQYVVMRLIDHVRVTAGPSWRPAKVCLQSHEAPPWQLREALGDPEIRIGQRSTGIAIPRALLAQDRRQRGTSEPASDQASESQLVQTGPTGSLPDALRQLVGALLKDGCPPIATLAEIAGLSVRSLQRRLAKAGVNYTDLVDQARFEVARRRLEDDGATVTDIALELGYSDAANFARAFRRWAGLAPRDYRDLRLAA